MAIGDDAISVGYAIVPNTGTEGRVGYGAREINRTRDYIAAVKMALDSRPANKVEYQQAVGIHYGTGAPPNSLGASGDLYFRYG